MRILEVEAENFMASAPTRLRFPRTGVVLVTGPNGHSKSSLIEMVSAALFGRTLRGSPWWPQRTDAARKKGEGVPSSRVRLVTDVVVAERMRVSRKNGLEWSLNGAEDAGRVEVSSDLLGGRRRGASEGVLYETATQAQDALEEVIGDFDGWRRCSVISSADAAHFSLATDGERKRLLERLLGLERFDEGLERCRADLKLAEGDFNAASRRLGEARSDLDRARARLEQATAELDRVRAVVPEEAPEPGPAAADARGLEAQLREAQEYAVRASRMRVEAERAHGRAGLLLEQARRAAGQFAAGLCPMCGQAAGDRRDSSGAAVLAAEHALAEAGRSLEAACSEQEEADWVVSGLQRRVGAIRAERVEAAQRSNARAQAVRRLAQVEREVESLRGAVEQHEVAVAAAEAELGRAGARVKLLTAAEAVLGLRGFRAHVLAGALRGLTDLANLWLPRLGRPEMRVRLEPYAEKKSGGVKDAISLEVEGAAGGYGYPGSSAGERRRIDVAVLLALAGIGQAATARTGGSLFFDEVFDALDADGVASLSAVLGDLSRDRMVMVVTHNPDLVELLRPRAAMRIEMVSGAARVAGGNGAEAGQGTKS